MTEELEQKIKELENVLQNMRAETQKREQGQIAIREAITIIASKLDLSEVLNLIAERMCKIVDATSTYICRWNLEDSTSSVLCSYFSSNACDKEKLPEPSDLYSETDEEFSEDMIAGRQVVVHTEDTDLSDYDRDHMLQYGAKSIAFIPLLIKGEAVAYCEIWESRQRREFNPEELSSCHVIAQHAIVAIENARLYEVAQTEIAERKLIEKELHDIQGDLENRVVNRTFELTQTNTQLKKEIEEREVIQKEKERLLTQLYHSQKMEAIGMLAGHVAHDLNNILAGIVSYPDLLLMDLPENSYFREPILKIKKSGDKAAAVVQDLLTLARRGVSNMEIVNLKQIISDYLQSPEHKNLLSLHPGVSIETHLESDLLNIWGSSVHLSKTIMNLIFNAAESMPEGGMISIVLEHKYVDKSIAGYEDTEEGDYIVLTITDTGVGILSEYMNRIFEPFFTKKVMGRSGTGLGLAVVWGTVKDHNGYIDVKSTPGQETTFKLYFPVTRDELEKDDDQLPAIEDFKGHGESILVVDDAEDQNKVISIILNKLGYCVTSVSSGEAAVDTMKNNSYDLIILDMIMDPGIDGLETYRQIIKMHPHQKAIIISGYSETDRVKEAQRLGAGACIKKPFHLKEIGAAVRNELNKAKGDKNLVTS